MENEPSNKEKNKSSNVSRSSETSKFDEERQQWTYRPRLRADTEPPQNSLTSPTCKDESLQRKKSWSQIKTPQDSQKECRMSENTSNDQQDEILLQTCIHDVEFHPPLDQNILSSDENILLSDQNILLSNPNIHSRDRNQLHIHIEESNNQSMDDLQDEIIHQEANMMKPNQFSEVLRNQWNSFISYVFDENEMDCITTNNTKTNGDDDSCPPLLDPQSTCCSAIGTLATSLRSIELVKSTWILLLLLGICTSLLAWTIDEIVLGLGTLHYYLSIQFGGWLTHYILWLILRVVIVLTAVSITHYSSPLCAGSGIPEIRSILGGFYIPNYLTFRAMVVKSLGLIFALGSGLSIGKEGPFVHISCCIASQFLKLKIFRQIRKSPDLTNHVLTAACAAGVTATFGAPVGGVLFSIEVTTSYYMTSNYWRAFFCSVVGVVMFRWLNSYSSFGNPVSLFTTEFDVLPYKDYEIIFFLILASICGALGGYFVRFYAYLVSRRRKYQTRFLGEKPFKYAIFVALLFGILEYPSGSIMVLSYQEAIDDLFTANDLKTANSTLLSTYGFSWGKPSVVLNLTGFAIVRFLSTAVSATVAVPSGIVTPIFAVGAAGGRLFGEVISFIGGGTQIPGGYAVVGAASFTAGVTGTISIAVIVFELTCQLSYMVPVLLSVLVGRAIGSYISMDIYETIGDDRRLPRWPYLSQQKSYTLAAGDFMRPSPPCRLERYQSQEKLRSILKSFPEVILFPIVDTIDTMIYIGSVDRYILENLLCLWERCHQSISSFTFDNTSNEEMKVDPSSLINDIQVTRILSPKSRRALITSRKSYLGLNQSQRMVLAKTNSTSPVDLVGLELIEIESVNFHVHQDTLASRVILFMAVHKCQQVFVTNKGKLVGSIHSADLIGDGIRRTL